MSGIIGLYHLDGRPAEERILQRMAQAIAHRGPDGIRFWSDGPVGLGHLMLQTTPESARERQPLTNPEATLCLTVDGRIDNRRELRQALDSNGFPPRDDTDAELLLRAYECWGESCPNRLLGDFAFAIWDARKKQLFCARDYVGVKPFYYHRSATLFAFGSEIRAVLALETVPRRLNESRVVDFLVEQLDREDEESTFYQDVQRLPAGHSLTVSPGKFLLRDYWELKAPPVLKLGSLQEYGEAFREVFVEAVRCRLRSTYPVASTLSGGIDSSSVVCTVRELLASELQEPLHTISLVDADEAKCGETPLHSRGPSRRLGDSAYRALRPGLGDDGADEGQRRAFRNLLLLHQLVRLCRGQEGRGPSAAGRNIRRPHHLRRTRISGLHGAFLASGELVRRELSFSARESMANPGCSILMNVMAWLRCAGRIWGCGGGFAAANRDLIPRDSVHRPDFAVRMGIPERLELNRRKLWAAARDIDALHSWSFTCGSLAGFL